MSANIPDKYTFDGVDLGETTVNTMHTHREFMDTLSRAQAAERALVELKERTRWIPVGEKLPPLGILVDVWCSHGYSSKRQLYKTEAGSYFWQNDIGWDYAYQDVTHWRMVIGPLPELPEADHD